LSVPKGDRSLLEFRSFEGKAYVYERGFYLDPTGTHLMAASIHFSAGAITDGTSHSKSNSERARRISPEAGRALEILGHAIEYLADEYVNETKNLSATDPQVAAIGLLMSLNRQVYYECPVIPTFSVRIRAFLGGVRA
jgi:hypothetical protein